MTHEVTTPHVLMLLRLKKLSGIAVSDFFQGKFDTIQKYVEEKSEVLTKIVFEDGVSVINDNEASEFFKLIHPEDRSRIGLLIKAIIEEEQGVQDIPTSSVFSDEEISQIASDEFYSWICGEEYVENMLDISKVTLSIDVPDNLHSYIEETRKCFALKQYLSVCALSRMALEAFTLHLCDLLGEEPEKNEYDQPLISSAFNIVTKKAGNTIKRQLYSIRNQASRRIHLDKMADKKTAKKIMQQTFSLIEKTYHSNGF